MTGEWRVVCTAQLPVKVDVAKLGSLKDILCNTPIQPETITNIRLSVTSIVGNVTGVGMRDLSLPSDILEIPVGPVATVHAGATTTIIVDFKPHIVCQGNGDCKLTPVLQATTQDQD
jgi:uncharacterized membrane protein AbrB (regulator of aidB expression)